MKNDNICKYNFNSTMVQLKLVLADLDIRENPEFQFLNGSIKAMPVKGKILTSMLISIPQWFN